jgi:hypothetical protein
VIGGHKVHKPSRDMTVAFVDGKQPALPSTSPVNKCWLLTEVVQVLLDGLPCWDRWEKFTEALAKVFKNAIPDGKNNVFDNHRFDVSIAYHTVDPNIEVPAILHAIVDYEDYLRRQHGEENPDTPGSSSSSSSSLYFDLTMKF